MSRSKRKSQRTVAPPPDIIEEPVATADVVRLGIGLVWVFAFVAVFSLLTLPNNPEISRLYLWLELPTLLVSWLPGGVDETASFGNLKDRIPILFTAAGMIVASLSLGRLLLRTVRVGDVLTRVERVALALGLGHAAWSLITLALGYAGLLSRVAFIGPMLLAVAGEVACTIRERSAGNRPSRPDVDRRSLWIVLAVSPFLLLMLLGALLPSIDFDVKAYHLTGPKEWFLAGEMFWLPHNVYTSFPFLTEMLALWGMVLRADWLTGAVAGKVVLMTFAPISALAVYSLGRRFVSVEAGLMGALLHVSTPWTYRVSIIAYAEGGLTCYLILTLLAAAVTLSTDSITSRKRLALLTGLLGGSAMACKYPGVVSVVIPVGLWLLLEPRRASLPKPPTASGATPESDSTPPPRTTRDRLTLAVAFSLGVFIAVGPWLVKNTVETGNPVYPLLYGVFGGADWSPELNAKWKAGHSPDGHAVLDLFIKLSDVTLRSDWLSPLLYAFAPLSLLLAWRSPIVRRGWLFLLWSFLTWWVLTHRIDRFWIPMLPAVALLAGVGYAKLSELAWQFRPVAISLRVMVTLCLLWCFGFMGTSLCGFNRYFASFEDAHRTAQTTAPLVASLNRAADDLGKVLFVGETQVFDAAFLNVYHAVFDQNIFEQWAADPQTGRAFSSEAIGEKLRREGITHVAVNWQEILRYRTTYGYSDFVTAAVFDRLEADGVLVRLDDRFPPQAAKLSDRDASLVRKWSPELLTEYKGETLLRTWSVYKVVDRGS